MIDAAGDTKTQFEGHTGILPPRAKRPWETPRVIESELAGTAMPVNVTNSDVYGPANSLVASAS